MTTTRGIVVVMALFTVTMATACSKPAPSKTDSDSASPRADSVTAAAIAASPVPAGTSPAGGVAPAATKQTTPSTPVVAKETPRTSTPGAVGTRPHLIKLTPASGSLASGAAILVDLTADRLTPTGNTVYFGTIKLGELASSDGKAVRFTVPEHFPARGEVAPMKVQAGTYPVYIVNANGTSDTLTFTLRDQ
jgi:hypothetical protein